MKTSGWLVGFGLACALVGCVLGKDEKDPVVEEAAYGPPVFSGYALVYRNGAKVDSLDAPEPVLAAFDDIRGRWKPFSFKVRGDSFTAVMQYLLPVGYNDTTVMGKVVMREVAYINPSPYIHCDSLGNNCYAKQGDEYSIRTCVDWIFDSASFTIEAPRSNSGWKHKIGQPCKGQAVSDPNMIRAEIRIAMPKR